MVITNGFEPFNASSILATLTKNGCEVKWLRCQLVTLFGAGSTPVTSAKIVI